MHSGDCPCFGFAGGEGVWGGAGGRGQKEKAAEIGRARWATRRSGLSSHRSMSSPGGRGVLTSFIFKNLIAVYLTYTHLS